MKISFSGLDGAGKTTQIKKLLKTYQQMGAQIGTVYTYLPDIRYHSIDDLHSLYANLNSFDVVHVRYRLNSNKNNAIMQKLERKAPPQHIYAILAALQGYADHKILSEYVLEPLLSNNKTLIFDRYYYDELAFKYTYGCPQYLLNSLYKNSQNSDVGFYIRIPADECIKRNQHRPDSKVPLYQNLKSINTLIEQFDYIANKKSLITMDGTLNEDELAYCIKKHVFSPQIFI